MSIYLCSACNKFHETKAEMKNCKHIKEVEKVEVLEDKKAKTKEK